MKFKFSLLFLFMCLFFEMVAQTIQKDTIALQEVIISASRMEKKLKDVAIATTIIKGKEIQRANIIQFKDFLENELLGVSFTNKAGGAQINMLGFDSKYILFLIDGEKIAGETFDNIDYNRINVNNIDRIEIIKGAASSLYGSNAIGGVVNIITKKPNRALEGSFSADYETHYQQQHYFASAGTKQKWGSLSLSASYKSQLPYVLTDRKLSADQEENFGVETMPNSTIMAGYTDYGVQPKMSFALGENTKLDIHSSLYYKYRDTGDDDAKKTQAQYYDLSNGAKLHTQWGKSQLNFGLTHALYQKYDKYFLLRRRDKNYENEILQANMLYDTKFQEKHYWVFGVEYLTDALLSFMFDSNGAYQHREARTVALFAQQDWKLSPSLTLVTGLRADHHSEFGSFFTSRLLASYALPNAWHLRGGYSAGFRSPTLKELYTNWFHPYGGGFQILGNKHLGVEKSDSFNVSAEYKKQHLSLLGLVQFSHIADKIDLRWKNADEIQYQNIGQTNLLSTELSVHYMFASGLSLKGGYTFSHHFEQKTQTNRPHIGTMLIDYTPKLSSYKCIPSLRISGKYQSPLRIYEAENKRYVSYEGYQMWRASAAVTFSKGLSVALGANNIFNYTPDLVSFYSSTSLGRTFFAQLKYQF